MREGNGGREKPDFGEGCGNGCGLVVPGLRRSSHLNRALHTGAAHESKKCKERKQFNKIRIKRGEAAHLENCIFSRCCRGVDGGNPNRAAPRWLGESSRSRSQPRWRGRANSRRPLPCASGSSSGKRGSGPRSGARGSRWVQAESVPADRGRDRDRLKERGAKGQRSLPRR